jgi:uncharacterized oxidoreductase
MKLTGQTIVITGGSSGIGLSLAKQLAEQNTVIIAGRDERKLESARSSIPGLRTIACDIGQAAERIRLSQALIRDYPKLNVLINNAGVQHHLRFDADHASRSVEILDEEINVNLLAPVHLCSLLIPHLLERPSAAIMNVTTGLVIVPKVESPLYSASKSALSTFTSMLRTQLRDSSIQVTEAMPPLVDTPMTHGRGRGKITPDACAAEMVRGLEQGKSVIRVDKVKLLYVIHRISPGLARTIMAMR